MRLLFNLLYDAALRCFYFSIVIASLWNEKAKKWLVGRKNLFLQIESSLKANEHRVWFHCASTGEFEQGRPVIEAYRKKFPQHKIVLTFFSPSGYELRKNYPGADYIFYLPLDTKANAKRFVSLVAPSLVVFVKYEFWFHILFEIDRRIIPAVVISAAFRKNHFLFNTIASPLKRVLMAFRKIFVQDESSLQLLKQHGFANAELAGDTRFDRVWEISSAAKQIPLIENFRGEKKLFVAGSTWSPDEKLILRLAAEGTGDWKFVIVPHEIDSNHLQRLRNESRSPLLFYSEAEAGKKISVREDSFGGEKILVVDNMGLLSSIYQYADIVYIGGGFGQGIHNTLEAAVYGIPVLFGPNYQKFPEARMLVENSGGISVSNYEELKIAFEFYGLPETSSLGKANREWVKKNTGATDLIIKFLEQLNSGSASLRV